MVKTPQKLVRKEEKNLLLDIARKNNIEKGSGSFELLEVWLSEKYDTKLFALWQTYIIETLKPLPEPVRLALKTDLLEKSRRIAEAAGGFLGFGKISPKEEAVLSKIEKSF